MKFVYLLFLSIIIFSCQSINDNPSHEIDTIEEIKPVKLVRDPVIEINDPNELDYSIHQLFIDTTRNSKFYDQILNWKPNEYDIGEIENNYNKLRGQFGESTVDIKDFPKQWISIRQYKNRFVAYNPLNGIDFRFTITDSTINNYRIEADADLIRKSITTKTNELVLELRTIPRKCIDQKVFLRIKKSTHKYLYTLEISPNEKFEETEFIQYITPLENLVHFDLIVDTSPILLLSRVKFDKVLRPKVDEKEQLINTFKHLIPQGYKINKSFVQNIDKNNIDEFIVHCTSNKKVNCDLKMNYDCYQDELLIFDNNRKSLLNRFLLHHPLTDDSNHVELDVDSSGIVTIKEYFRPTCCSGVNREQFYSFKDSTFVLDSLSHSVSTKSGLEYYQWGYNFNFITKTLRFNSSFMDMSSEESYNNSGQQTDTTLIIQLEKKFTIENKIRLEELIPKGIETPWY